MRSTKTDVNGKYDFVVPAANYFVVPEPARLWYSHPGQIPLSTNNVIGSGDFQMGFVPAQVAFNGIPGTFILITTYSYTQNVPPPVGEGFRTVGAVTTAIDQLMPRPYVDLAGGHAYWFKCWKPVMAGQALFNYVANTPQTINGGAVLWPQERFTETCL